MSAGSETYPVSAEPLERLHALLVEAVRRRRGADPHASPVTVAEIYQELAPYRSVRAALGLELNADYEHTLLRLLSGEAQLARIEPAAAREQLQRELDSPNPNVTLYRKFAGCDVWLLATGSPTPAWVAEHLADEAAAPAEAGPEPGPEPPAVAWEPGTDDVAPAPVTEAAAMLPEAAGNRIQQPRRERMNEQDEAGGAGAAPVVQGLSKPPAEGGHCAFCDSLLPVFRQVRFCPFCGADQSQRPCAGCGEPLQPDWSFCIACGEAVAAAGA